MSVNLKHALAAEKQDLHAQFSAQLALSPAEQRRQGVLLYPLTIRDQHTEGQRTVVSFVTSFAINDTFFRRGCLIKWMQENLSGEGRLLELDEKSGAFSTFEEEIPNFKDAPVTLQFVPDDKTMKCMELGLRLAEEDEDLKKIARGFEDELSLTITENFPGLNQNQSVAANAILGEQPVVLIQGPPGTGKTHTLATALAEMVKQGRKIIISAPSNTAVDNLCHALLDRNIRILRVGNEEKMSARTEAFTIEGYLERGQEKKVIENLKKALRKADEAAGKFIRNLTKEAAAERSQARRERTQLRKEIRQAADEARKQLLSTIPVIAGTPVGLFNELPKDFKADICVIDEAGQAPEPLTWLAASFGKRLVLCGDPMQLPPVVFSARAKQLGLGKSLLERAMTPGNSVLLNEQYRMAPEIVSGINSHFYNNELKTVFTERTGKLQFIDMAGFGEGEQQDETSGSIFNPDEAAIVRAVLSEYAADPKSTVILSPYNAQLGTLRTALGPDWRVSTIDSIQGQEEETVVISLTRSNMEGEIGFLKDYRRTNVAISRAKTTCIIVGDSSTLGGDAFYGKLIDQLESSGAYRSAWELQTDF